jgi:CheY-like chemotaxis protein
MEHPGLRGLSILVVENELLIAMDIAKALESAGANATMTTTARHAMILADHDGLAGAILDHGLTDGDSTAVCARLKERGIPYISYSGYRFANAQRSSSPRWGQAPAPQWASTAARLTLIESQRDNRSTLTKKLTGNRAKTCTQPRSARAELMRFLFVSRGNC